MEDERLPCAGLCHRPGEAPSILAKFAPHQVCLTWYRMARGYDEQRTREMFSREALKPHSQGRTKPVAKAQAGATTPERQRSHGRDEVSVGGGHLEGSGEQQLRAQVRVVTSSAEVMSSVILVTLMRRE